jgi:branched-chain amino acid transport system ATP-binding protein
VQIRRFRANLPFYPFMVGANGAGKTALLNTISGLLHPASGSIEFLVKRIDGLTPHVTAELSMSHILEGRNFFLDSRCVKTLR